MNKNLCSSCKFAKWDNSSMNNASCEQIPVGKIIDENNYVTECSAYFCNNVIKCFINFVRGK